MDVPKYSVGYKIKNVLRVAYTLPFVLASITGAVFALTQKTEWLMAFLIPLDVFFLAMFVNLSNDYYDHKSGSDKVRFDLLDKAYEERASGSQKGTIYWQGNSFDRSLISERGGQLLMAILAGLAVLVAIPIILYGGVLVIVLGLVAFFLSFFYTAPPLHLGSRGLGELDVGISFAFMSFFTYYVIVGRFDWTMLIIAVTVGMNVMNMRIVDQMSGIEAHKLAGEKDLVVRLGIDKATEPMWSIWFLMYALCLVLVYLNWTFVILYLSARLAFQSIRYLRKKEGDLWVVAPVLSTFKLALSHMLLVIVALILQSVLTFA